MIIRIPFSLLVCLGAAALLGGMAAMMQLLPDGYIVV